MTPIPGSFTFILCRIRRSREPENDEVPVNYRKPFKNPLGARHPDTKFRLDEVDAQDFMAWETQGPILDRTRESAGRVDHGVVMYREMLLRGRSRKCSRELDPMNVFRDPTIAIIDTKWIIRWKSVSGLGDLSRAAGTIEEN